jgi:hypothetical protein
LSLPVPICFISYSWDSTVHKEWVRKLAESLQENGVKVLLDQWDLSPGEDFLAYIETSIRDSNFVILVCTPNYARKANERQGGAGYENSIVTGELFHRESTGKFVPILRSGDEENSLPSFLRSRIYVDFTKDSYFEDGPETLLRKFHEAPFHVRPPLGSRPEFASSRHESGSRNQLEEVTYCTTCGALAGTKTSCITFSGDHDFATKSGTIFCATCGEQFLRRSQTGASPFPVTMILCLRGRAPKGSIARPAERKSEIKVPVTLSPVTMILDDGIKVQIQQGFEL